VRFQRIGRERAQAAGIGPGCDEVLRLPRAHRGGGGVRGGIAVGPGRRAAARRAAGRTTGRGIAAAGGGLGAPRRVAAGGVRVLGIGHHLSPRVSSVTREVVLPPARQVSSEAPHPVRKGAGRQTRPAARPGCRGAA
jgi:hypothetical protein